MKHRKVIWQIIAIFAGVLVGYVLVFRWVEHRRVAKGPWVVKFASESGVPTLTLNHDKLGIRDVRITFPDEQLATNVSQTLDFAEGRAVPFDVPFGKCVFLDALFLPGTAAFEMFGHEIQFMPRFLTIDRVEHPWRSGQNIELHRMKTNSPGK